MQRVAVVSILIIALGACDDGDPAGETLAIDTQADADAVAFEIAYQLTGSYLWDDYTYEGQVMNGGTSGTMTVTGTTSFGDTSSYDSYTVDVDLDLDDYCGDGNYVHLSGTASIGGVVMCDDDSYEYSGAWTLSGTLEVTGHLEGTVDINLDILSEYGTPYAGSITAEGTTWGVYDD
jgi:hypothetical protein